MPPACALTGVVSCWLGNLWGLHERSTAVESLTAVAVELRAARTDVLSYVPASEHPVVEHFFSRTVEASGDCYSLALLSTTHVYAFCVEQLSLN